MSSFRHIALAYVACFPTCGPVWATEATTDAWAGSSHVASVEVKNGNIFFWNGQEHQLTHSGNDANPVLSPDGNWVAFTRVGDHSNDEGDATPACEAGEKADELRRVRVDGSREELLYRGRNDANGNICNFDTKQFTSDGRYIYFLSPGWVTSAALYRFDIRPRPLPS